MAEIDLPQRRTLPGGGYLDASQQALDTLAEAMERERAWGTDANGQRVIRHPAEIAAERRQAEAEASRKVFGVSIVPNGVVRAVRELQCAARPGVCRASARYRAVSGEAGRASAAPGGR